MISLHTSPLLQPGSGDSGGMNVYVREVASALAQAGVECTTYTRADRPGLAPEVQVEPPRRHVHHPVSRLDLDDVGQTLAVGARVRRAVDPGLGQRRDQLAHVHVHPPAVP